MQVKEGVTVQIKEEVGDLTMSARKRTQSLNAIVFPWVLLKPVVKMWGTAMEKK